ncbi:response regulator transcription factor [Xanthocytophaga agilis]|uniref:Response regulator transcription factor n=1 Tax=Xanthocytophaga agilis TaxID=3048010 RepID=A0AAE3UHQ7_9BACT|nr:response regulator transcription factor [Xanthocytophaga agilis]MDJ1503747.1 response regulator transcription factor [Xanthocytophaga agilis]
MPVRVVLYEDNLDLRDSLTVLLKGTDGIEFLDAFPNCEHVIAQIGKLQPDLILMDIDMPVVNGLSGLRTVKKHFPEVNVLMLTVFEDNEYIFDAICAGAVGYLLKKTPPARLIEAIHEAQSGGAPMTSSIARKVLQMFPQTPVKSEVDNPHNLTDREREILALLVKGNSYKMIAAACSISLDTVRSHIKKIYEKLHVHSQTEAVAKAIQQRLV